MKVSIIASQASSASRSITKSIITAAILFASTSMFAGNTAFAQSVPGNAKAGKGKTEAAKAGTFDASAEAHEVHSSALGQNSGLADGILLGVKAKSVKIFKSENDDGSERKIGLHSAADVQIGASNKFNDSKSAQLIGNASILEAVDLHRNEKSKVIVMPAAGYSFLHSNAGIAEGGKIQAGAVLQTKRASFSALVSPTRTNFTDRMSLDSGTETYSGQVGLSTVIGGRLLKSGKKEGGMTVSMNAGAGRLINMGNQDEKVNTSFQVLQSTTDGNGHTTVTTTVLGTTRSPTQNTKIVKTDTNVACGTSSITIKQIDDLLQAQRRSNAGLVAFANLNVSAKVTSRLALNTGIEYTHVAYTGKEKDLNEGYSDYSRKDNSVGIKVGATYDLFRK
ncbi:MAG: hypothetical protein H7222_15370 [Methylotenera sp.]|nr:hypothetical protein [Oligoflexia bacterium]